MPIVRKSKYHQKKQEIQQLKNRNTQLQTRLSQLQAENNRLKNNNSHTHTQREREREREREQLRRYCLNSQPRGKFPSKLSPLCRIITNPIPLPLWSEMRNIFQITQN